MTSITADRLKEIAALANELPDEYRVAAFRELVRHDLSGGHSGTSDPRPPGGAGSTAVDGEESDSIPERPGWFAGVLEKMPEMHAFAAGSRDAQAAWALVELYRRGKAVTPTEARNLIKDELGISPEARQHLSRRLGGFTPRFATRVKSGTGYKYEPTVNVVEMFPKEKDAE